MTLKQKIASRRKLAPAIVAGVAVVAFAIGGSAIADSVSSDGGSGSANAATAAEVVPFQSGQPGPSKTVGEVPSSYSAGTGTIITGTAADKAETAALAAYAGGTVNRVVELSSGEYNVHMIGVAWPHHVFVNQDFEVIGAT